MAKRKLKDALAMMPSRPNQGANATFRTRPPSATSQVSPAGGQAPKPKTPGLAIVEKRRRLTNTTTNPRKGKAFDEVSRAGRTFHVYHSGGKRQVFEIHRPTVSGKKPQKTTPGIDSSGARNGALGQGSALSAASQATRRLESARRGAASRGALSAAAERAMAQPRSGVAAQRNRRRRTSSVR